MSTSFDAMYEEIRPLALLDPPPAVPAEQTRPHRGHRLLAPALAVLAALGLLGGTAIWLA